jgi:hypothetical protein
MQTHLKNKDNSHNLIYSINKYYYFHLKLLMLFQKSKDTLNLLLYKVLFLFVIKHFSKNLIFLIRFLPNFKYFYYFLFNIFLPLILFTLKKIFL